MRKQNSEFRTAFTSEADRDLRNTDYFGFVELDDFACYVIADGIDDQSDAVSAKLAVAAAVSAFSESPSMSRGRMRACLRAANRALWGAKSKRKLKASIIVVLTNYVKLRYGQAGNIRLRLYRNGFLKLQSRDQSLTADMVRNERVESDKAALHEERNNLYTYLGQEKGFHPYISKKIKLSGADAIALYTRGIWEHIDEGELQDVFADATDDPEKSVGEVEELLLSRQPPNLHKYTLAVLFINKVFTDPNKKRKIKRILMILIPVLIAAVILTVILAVRHNKKMERMARMEQGYTDTIEYIQSDNYIRAQESCKEAQKEAVELKDRKMQKELGNYLKLIEAVAEADKLLDDKKYGEAQKAYREAEIRSRYVDQLGLDYIQDRLALTANYMSVYDLIQLGDSLALNLQYEEAEQKYLEAKSLAGKLYFEEGRAGAMDALETLYSGQKAEQEAENEAVREQAARQEAGASHVAQGDEAYAKGDYDGARAYYTSARQTYAQMGDEIQEEAAAAKLAAADEMIAQRARQEAEAQGYMTEAQRLAEAEDFTAAKKYYLLAKDVYAGLKMDEKVQSVERKIEVLGIKEAEMERLEAQERAEEAAREEGKAQEAASPEAYGPGVTPG